MRSTRHQKSGLVASRGDPRGQRLLPARLASDREIGRMCCLWPSVAAVKRSGQRYLASASACVVVGNVGMDECGCGCSLCSVLSLVMVCEYMWMGE